MSKSLEAAAGSSGAVFGDRTTSGKGVKEAQEATRVNASATAAKSNTSAFDEIDLLSDFESEVDIKEWEEIDKRSVADDDKHCQAAANPSVLSTVRSWFGY